MTDRRQTEFLLEAGRLLLEYNESTGEIHSVLTATAKTLTPEPLHLAVAYGSVAVSLGRESPVLETVKEIRYNAAMKAHVHAILAQVRTAALDVPTALSLLRSAERDTPRHPRWLVVLMFGAAAASFARLLGADAAATATAAVSTCLGLLARQELGRRHVSLFALPLTAAFIGAVLGGLCIRLGWTRSPELALVVPALMLVPGPHLINGLFDLIDNHLPMSLSRLGLAAGILLASSLGVAIGVEAISELGMTHSPDQSGAPNLAADILLAGIATCGFAAFYNAPWVYIGWAVAGGMAGHGTRFLCLKAGFAPEIATFLGGLIVGIVAAGVARSRSAPVAIMAFAGAVTMIPGVTLYRALAGALQIARLPNGSDVALAAETLNHACQGAIVVSGLALGLVLGMRCILSLLRGREAA